MFHLLSSIIVLGILGASVALIALTIQGAKDSVIAALRSVPYAKPINAVSPRRAMRRYEPVRMQFGRLRVAA